MEVISNCVITMSVAYLKEHVQQITHCCHDRATISSSGNHMAILNLKLTQLVFQYLLGLPCSEASSDSNHANWNVLSW